MPTGYTAKLCNGDQPFEEFALECARAFGALVTLRDEPDAKIPDTFNPSDYHAKELAKAEKLRDKLNGMSIKDAEKSVASEFSKELKAWEDRVAECATMRRRLEAMVSKVKAWTPPSDDHSQYKQFMLEQLKTTIDGDCLHWERPKKLSGENWLRERIRKAEWDIEYHTKEHAGEIDRATSRTLWVQRLKRSLGIKVVG